MREVLGELFAQLGAGQRVEVSRVVEMLTTQEAADLISVSQPTLVKMLQDGVLPYEQPGVHRRVPRAAIEEYLTRVRQGRSRALDAFAQTQDEDGPDQIPSTR